MEKWENNFETRTNEWEPQVISTAPATTGAQQYKAYRPGSQSSLVFGGDHKIWLSILFGKKKKKGKRPSIENTCESLAFACAKADLLAIIIIYLYHN